MLLLFRLVAKTHKNEESPYQDEDLSTQMAT